MKCDELRDFEVVLSTEYQFVEGVVFRSKKFYSKDSVDEAIDELKQKLHDAEMAKDDAEAANTEYREDIRKLKAENERLDDLAHAHNLELLQKENIISEFKADNERLNKELIEWIQSAANRPVVIGKLRDELRSTKHALWMARALALSRFDVDKYIRTHMMSNYWKCGNEIFVLACKAMQNKINKAKEILIEKAEEYK